MAEPPIAKLNCGALLPPCGSTIDAPRRVVADDRVVGERTARSRWSTGTAATYRPTCALGSSCSGTLADDVRTGAEVDGAASVADARSFGVAVGRQARDVVTDLLRVARRPELDRDVGRLQELVGRGDLDACRHRRTPVSASERRRHRESAAMAAAPQRR